MDVNATTSSILEEGEAVEFLTPRKQRTNSWLKFGVPLVLVTVGVVAYNHAAGAYPFQRAPTTFERIISVHNKFMKAFTARALSDDSVFSSSLEVYLKQKEAKDPSAMTLNAKVHHNEGSSVDWPKAMVALVAQDDKQDDLVDKLNDIKTFVTGGHCDGEHKHPVCQLDIKKQDQSQHFGEGKFVLLTMNLPKDPNAKKMDADMKAAMEAHNIEFHTDICVGRTFEDMYEHKNANLVELLQGIGIKASAHVASSFFDAIADEAPSADDAEGIKMLKGLAKVSGRVDIEYKHALHEYFGGIPTFENEIDDMRKNFQNLHPHLREHLKGLEDSCAGVKGVVMNAGMDDFEIVYTLENFHPTPVISSMVS